MFDDDVEDYFPQYGRDDRITADNFQTALQVAIKAQAHRESMAGYQEDSPLLKGWKQNLNAMASGMPVAVVYEK